MTDLLQKELGFQGLCFTDALAMKGASTKKTDNPSVKALLAGNDILLAPAAPINDFTAVKDRGRGIGSGSDRGQVLENIKVQIYRWIECL